MLRTRCMNGASVLNYHLSSEMRGFVKRKCYRSESICYCKLWIYGCNAMTETHYINEGAQVYFSLILTRCSVQELRYVGDVSFMSSQQRQGYLASSVCIIQRREGEKRKMKKKAPSSLSKTYKILALSHWTRCRFRSS